MNSLRTRGEVRMSLPPPPGAVSLRPALASWCEPVAAASSTDALARAAVSALRTELAARAWDAPRRQPRSVPMRAQLRSVALRLAPGSAAPQATGARRNTQSFSTTQSATTFDLDCGRHRVALVGPLREPRTLSWTAAVASAVRSPTLWPGPRALRRRWQLRCLRHRAAISGPMVDHDPNKADPRPMRLTTLR